MQGFSPVKPEDVEAKAFEGTRISCNEPKYFPEARFSWTFERLYDTQIDAKTPIFDGHENMFVSRSGYLYFSSAQNTDQGRFYCTVTLSFSPGYLTSTSQPPIVTGRGVTLYVKGTGRKMNV